MKIHVIKHGDARRLYTTGLADEGYPELSVEVTDQSLKEQAKHLLRLTARYMRDEKLAIKANETMSYGCWLLRFQAGVKGLEVWECDDEWTGFVPGAERALRLWYDQAEVCNALGSSFLPPLASTKTAVSAGVLEGEPLEGIRYPPPPHMSGWYLSTDLYDGNIKSMKVIHLYHVIARRPEIARYLALAPGHYFRLYGADEVGFLEDVAQEEPC